MFPFDLEFLNLAVANPYLYNDGAAAILAVGRPFLQSGDRVHRRKVGVAAVGTFKIEVHGFFPRFLKSGLVSGRRLDHRVPVEKTVEIDDVQTVHQIRVSGLDQASVFPIPNRGFGLQMMLPVLIKDADLAPDVLNL